MFNTDAPDPKRKRSRVVAIVCTVMAALGIIICITESSDPTESLPPAIIFSIAAIIFWCISLSRPKAKANEDEYTQSLNNSVINSLDDCDLDEPFHTYHASEDVRIGDVSSVDGMEGHEFEYFCADLLRKDGFSEVSVTRGSGDQGVDILATKGGIKYAIQCKNYASALGNKPVQEVSAGKIFYNCHVGVVLTNSTFTAGAVSLAKATGVLLWDRSVLSELMKAKSTAEEATKLIEDCSTPALTQESSNTQNPPSKPIHTQPISPSVPLPHRIETSIQKKSVQIDNINIEIDVQSLSRYNIVLDNFGIEMEEEDDEDRIELLFDAISKNGRKLPCTIDIVCNLYAGSRKIMTEREAIYEDSFNGRDSLCVYFDKKRICKSATKIELFCQKW